MSDNTEITYAECGKIWSRVSDLMLIIGEHSADLETDLGRLTVRELSEKYFYLGLEIQNAEIESADILNRLSGERNEQ